MSDDRLESNPVPEEEYMFFGDDDADRAPSLADAIGCWKIIIADDDPEVHQVTKLVLSDFEFDGKKLVFHSALTAAEAEQLLVEHPDTALILLDVVMEEEDSGLKLVKYIREQLKNNAIRIILRTGQPGQAPEKLVIMNYDINDYKEKTELTSQKLFTAIVSSLRSYRDIKVIESNKNGLEEIIKASSTIFELQSMKKFASGVLTQLTSIVHLHKNALHCSLAVTKDEADIFILAASGDFTVPENHRLRDVVDDSIAADIERSFMDKSSRFYDDRLVIYVRSKTGIENVNFLNGFQSLSEWDRYLIEIYCANVTIAFENIYLNQEVENTQKEIIFTMGEITETRSKETGYHVKRVAEYSKLLALAYGLPEEEAETIRLASPMHDVGKVGIPDDILNKPGKLTDDEFEVIKTHASIGHSMLKHSQIKLLNAAAIIAHQHHEHYDGSGYPNGLKGENIHIYGRIIAIADVFDALGSERVYKKAWELPEIIDLFKAERGKHFDPALVDIFLSNIEGMMQIRGKYTDQKVF
ncbi:DUF3369 domain-containing protein [Paenibacillus cymbidii]|uniref:DUF3369 domain-containing protein n=1 Tax=Paenibacillus cymbidii TaxID=1639034 RepID=UPI001A9ACAFC|nr:DUF3369 domain-containing protein [Paenibacillus cymbidii]